MSKTKKKRTQAEYDRLKFMAERYVVKMGYTQKETAERLGISEVSMSEWAKEGSWREKRTAEMRTVSIDTNNARKIINILSERRLNLENDIKAAEESGDKKEELLLRSEARSISDEISKQNKVIKDLEKNNKASLGDYIDIMEDIFNALRVYDEDLYYKTINFQSVHAQRKIEELG